ncbi:putative bifunctional diguanylate cyclase/phosphodiesterase [Maridesulfovibrio hydrothermalis]|uniref:Diguanylate cyclase/phosphodiesterase n=1 Tax=Maridesulfovibrio hydrothermalis AM13 = DSM 14728 TaxID=1121451 RepID=L0RDM0_9BACT|nr:bifunctional diguanylate cyclase/phosphodiesterase [Maridesulfovibrio hydrothermalis]CCO23661.1 Diguanylate cyclase/phosphodiesterase [Maridesulfovibrio hydrothermalis AM13 = DSM 14728]
MHAIVDSSDTFFFSNISAGLIILLGGVVCYLFILNKLRKNEPSLYRQTRTSFIILVSLIFSFVLGYSAVLASVIFHYRFDFNSILGPILFLGSIFVLATAYFNVAMFNKLLKSREVLKSQALRDFMTRLPNRRMLVDKIKLAQERKRINKNYDFAVIFIDILNFKKVNDSFGHYTGDKILIQTSNRLLKAVNSVDTVGRIGGDDFILLFDDSSPMETLHKMNHVRASLQKAYEIDGVEFKLDASYGIYFARDEDLPPEEIINRANMAMRRSKQRGKNNFSAFMESMLLKADNLLKFENDFRRGLQNNEFILVFQPQYNLKPNLSLAGFEALVRWNHPKQGWISPGDFIPIAEKTGLIIELDRYVLDRACMHWAQCQRKTPNCSGLSISVNLSAHYIIDSTLVRYVAETIKKHGIEKNTLILELTESAFVTDPVLAAANLESLRELGVKSAIDDFGTGYSSLTYLTRFPTEHIKIDKSFVDGIESDQSSRRIVKSVINLTHGLNMIAVAEGVEKKSQLEILKEMGCDIVQGFYLAKPLSLIDTRTFIKERKLPSENS